MSPARTRIGLLAAAALACVAMLLAASGAGAAAGDVVLVANPKADDLDGVDAEGLIPTVSEGGRYVGFVEDDSGGGTGVFLRAMSGPALIPVAVPSGGGEEELGYDADSPGISADGSTLVFASEDPSLSAEDVNFDRGPLGEATGNPVRDVFAYDRARKTISLVSRRSGAHGAAADNNSNLPAISADGRYVAFGTESRNLTPGSDIDGGVYVRDLKTKATFLVSRQSGAHGKPIGAWEPTVSGNGREVAFDWSYRRTRHHRDDEIGVRDLQRRRTSIASRTSGPRGALANDDCREASLSANGRYVAFASKATNLASGDDPRVEDVFVRDLKTGRTTLVSRAGLHGPGGGGDSSRPSISGDGRYVAFESFADDLGPRDDGAVTDVFVKDLRTGRVMLASHGPGGSPGNGDSASPSISPDGRYVVFNSKATNLSPEDSDRKIGVFRYQIR